MALFEFELSPVEEILPWGEPGNQSLSWFALSYGRFRMVVGEQTLFRYTDEILSHWEMTDQDADYQIAAFARDLLGSVAAAVAPLPPTIERLASDWPRLMELKKPCDEKLEFDELWYQAWEWLAERSPSTPYLVACPKFQMVRVGTELRIHWDNREQLIDGIQVWTARQGVHVISVEAFLNESHDFARRLLSEMHQRIIGLETGTMKPQVEVSTSSLREQHESWKAEFASYFGEYLTDVSWPETENALREIAERKGLKLIT
ncbi:DUF5984 family protein [Lacunimicrobium album]